MNQNNNKRILLINDRKHFKGFLRGDLLARNYEIVGEAKDCQQATKLFASEKPGLTLIDFEMLSANGVEVLEKIIAQDPDAVVIMLIERTDVATMQLCLDKGAFYCIGKDYPLETIFSVFEESLKGLAEIGS